MDGVKLEFTDPALKLIAKAAIKRGIGARALRAIIEEIMLDVMFEVPSDRDITRCVISRETVEQHAQPLLERGKRKSTRVKTA